MDQNDQGPGTRLTAAPLGHKLLRPLTVSFNHHQARKKRRPLAHRQPRASLLLCLVLASAPLSAFLHTLSTLLDTIPTIMARAATTSSRAAASCLLLAALARAIDPMWLQSSYQGGENAPGWQEGDAPGQTIFKTDGGVDTSGNYQLSTCPTILIGSAQVDGSPDDGWQQMPNVTGMSFDRFPLDGYGDAVLPYYIERGKNTTSIKRAIVVQPGKSRDAWCVRVLCAPGTRDADRGLFVRAGSTGTWRATRSSARPRTTRRR